MHCTTIRNPRRALGGLIQGPDAHVPGDAARGIARLAPIAPGAAQPRARRADPPVRRAGGR